MTYKPKPSSSEAAELSVIRLNFRSKVFSFWHKMSKACMKFNIFGLKSDLNVLAGVMNQLLAYEEHLRNHHLKQEDTSFVL